MEGLDIKWLTERDDEEGYLAECKTPKGRIYRFSERRGISFGMKVETYEEVMEDSVEIDGEEMAFMIFTEFELEVLSILCEIVDELRDGKDSEDIQEILDELESGKKDEEEEEVE